MSRRDCSAATPPVAAPPVSRKRRLLHSCEPDAATIDLTRCAPSAAAPASTSTSALALTRHDSGLHYAQEAKEFLLDEETYRAKVWRWEFRWFRWVKDRLSGVNPLLPDGTYATGLRSGAWVRDGDDSLRPRASRDAPPRAPPPSLRLRRVDRPLALAVAPGDVFWSWRIPPNDAPGHWARLRLLARTGISVWAAVPASSGAGAPVSQIMLVADGSARFTDVQPAQPWFLMHADEAGAL